MKPKINQLKRFAINIEKYNVRVSMDLFCKFVNRVAMDFCI